MRSSRGLRVVLHRKSSPVNKFDTLNDAVVGAGMTDHRRAERRVEPLAGLSLQREAVILKIYQGFKFEEMAEILSCPVSTVKSRLYAALDVLKMQLAPLKSRGVT